LTYLVSYARPWNTVEQEEEFVTNKLMKKLEKMNSEKREMLLRVEQEEAGPSSGLFSAGTLGRVSLKY